MARYFVSFECNGEICHTTGESTFPTKEEYYADSYSKKLADEIAVSFVNGYLDVKNLLGKVTPRNIRYTIEFPSN